MPSFRELLVIRVEHEYFENYFSEYFEMVPTEETQNLMRRRGIVLKSQAYNLFSFLAEEDSFGFFDDDRLRLEFRLKDPNFFLYTDMADFDMLSQYTLCCMSGLVEVVDSLNRESRKRHGGALFYIEIPLSESYQEAVVLKFRSKTMKWGYMLISNTGKSDFQSYLIESNDESVHFLKPESVDIPWQSGEKGGLVVSSEKIPLRARNDQRMTLYTVDAQRPNYRRVVQKNIEPPVIGEVLFKNLTKDMVISLLYI
ncbi:MAG: hypothetical protein IK005_12130 [Paludibacteraceae bacterium]|nr:hypothetical protein [Paludibacteraceae bacterium]